MDSFASLLHFLCAFQLILFLPIPILAKPPPPPVRCDATGCILSNVYGVWGDRTECRVQAVVFPTTEDELRSVVAEASRKNLKVKVATRFSGTIPKLACPPSPVGSILVSTAEYGRRIEMDVERRTVTADAGAGVRDVIERVEAAGLSLAAAPYWEGVSVGGAVSTGSHGSSWWGRGGAVHEYVVGLRMVVPAGLSEGYAKIIALGRGDEMFYASVVSLGLLGIISQVTLELEPRFKRSITYSFQDDALFQDDFMLLARKHEFADITWFPSQHIAAYRYDDRVPPNSTGNGVNDFIGFQPNLFLTSEAVRATEKTLDESRSIEGKCVIAKAITAYKRLVGTGLKNSLVFTGYPVVGDQGKMQTSGSCLHSPAADILSTCAWDPRIKGLFFYETTAIFPATKFRDFIRDVKKLRDRKPENFCGVELYNGFMIRFIKGSEAYLGQPEDSVVVDFNYYRADDPLTPRLNQDVWEEVEQMAFFKHKARPHWAKNRKVAFLGVQEKYPSFSKFLAAREIFDPQGIFQSPWSDEILFGRESANDDGCAMEGRCICSEDRHCSPTKGYLCKAGYVFQGARVCRYTDATAE